MNLIHDDNAAAGIYARSLGEIGFNVQVMPRDRVITQGSTQDVDLDDATYIEHTSAEVAHEATLAAIDLPLGQPEPEYQSLDESRATAGPNGTVTWVSGSGTVDFLAVGQHMTRKVPVEVGHSPSTTVNVFKEFKAGTLGRYMTDEVEAAIDETDPEVALPMFTAINHSSKTYTRNPNCWMSAEVLACLSVTNSNSGWSGFVLIAPDMAITAAHVGLATRQVGRNLYWCTAGNVTKHTTIADHRDIDGTDIRIVRLATPVADIEVARVMPADLDDYLIRTAHGRPPVVYGNQFHQAGIGEITHLGTGSTIAHTRPATTSPRRDYSVGLVNGDSGHGVISGIGGLPVVWGCHFWTHLCSKPSSYITEINAAMDDMGSASELSVIDLSAFEDFGA